MMMSVPLLTGKLIVSFFLLCLIRNVRVAPSDNEPIAVTIDRAGARSIAGEVMTDAAFAARIAALSAARPDARVVIRADAALPYGQVAALLADVTGAGFTS